MSKYDDIIDLPYVKSSKRPHMSNSDRAAQFAPFAALTGHKDKINETQRITEPKRILDENRQAILDQRIQDVLLLDNPLIKVEYFLKDALKNGGYYYLYEGELKKIDDYNKVFIFNDGTVISIEDIYDIEIS